MEVVHGGDMKYGDVGLSHRAGAPLFKYLFQGQEGTAENYLFALAEQSDFFSPRHKHNFEQFRFPLRGDFSIATEPEVVLHEGELGYFPEGVHYGPQIDGEEKKETLIMQFGGPSKQGYLSYAKLAEVQGELKKEGRFEKGKFFSNKDGEGSEGKDGYEALWERVNGRPLVYPAGRYHSPIIMKPDSFAWKQVMRGVYRKVLGVFSERETLAEMIKVQDGAQWAVEAKPDAIQLFLVIRGTGDVNGTGLKTQSAIRLLPGTKASISSASSIELLHIVNPNLSE